ncbi:MAG: Fe-S cluster assembly protein SufB [bacterium]|nr:Fe-S cluster assembly protein SufB [bacterium]
MSDNNPVGQYQYGFHDSDEKYSVKLPKGLSQDVVEAISKYKNEPAWMLEYRLKAYEIFLQKKIPSWGGDLTNIDFQNIHYFLRASDKVERKWEDVPDEIKNTFDKIGIPEAEKKFLAGVSSQYDSEVVYHNLKGAWEDKGVIFVDTDTAVREHAAIVQEYFGTVIPSGDNKFAALNSAVWSGGSFIYVPKGVHVDIPLQAYFRINAANAGQFERTLIIADEGSFVHYVEGCSAPIYTTDSLHSAVVEIICKPGARVRYTTIQNWSNNVYNLVTKRAFVYRDATMEWIDGNIGSRLTMKYPSVFLMEPGARGEVLSLAFAGRGQHQDAGAKAVHLASNTTSLITSKSISMHGGKTTYRGLVRVVKKADNCKSTVKCDALLMDDISVSDTYPDMKIENQNVTIGHEASVGKIGEEQLFYLMSRGLNDDQAASMIVQGFVEPIIRELPMEYAVELNRLIQLDMTGSVG